jgi:hypothetical protein
MVDPVEEQVAQEEAVAAAIESGINEMDVSEAQDIIIESDDTFDPYW